MKKKAIKQCLAVVLSLLLTVTTFAPTVKASEEEADTTARTKQECLTELYNTFSAYTSSKPLTFPYGTGEGQYTNAMTFLKDKVKEIVPEYDVEIRYGGTNPGSSVNENTMDKETLDIKPVHALNPTKPALTSVVFAIGDEISTTVKQIYFSVDPIQVTPKEAVEFEATQLDFTKCMGKNESLDNIFAPVGKPSGRLNVGALPTTMTIYKSGANKVTVTWELEHISGDDSMTMDKNYKINVVKPEVGGQDGKYRLKAIYKSDANPEISKTLTYDLTVPAFEGVRVPIQIEPEDATFTLTDTYYDKEVDSKYITKENGKNVYQLHSGADGKSSAEYEWTLEKPGYITKTGTLEIGKNGLGENTKISMSKSTEDDAKLESMKLEKPSKDAPSLKKEMASFDKNVYDYEMTVGAIDSIDLSAIPVVEEADVQISYYKSVAMAKNKKLTTTSMSSDSARTCYLLSDEPTVITFTVTAPDGSVTEENNKTHTYTLTVKREGEPHSLKSVVIVPKTADGQLSGDYQNDLPKEYQKENVLIPTLDAGGIADKYNYSVNYFTEGFTLNATKADAINVDKMELTYLKDGEEVTQQITSGKVTDFQMPLTVGDNPVTIKVTQTAEDGKAPVVETYQINVHRKQKPEGIFQIGSHQLDLSAVSNTSWDGTIVFPKKCRSLKMQMHLPENTKVLFECEEGQYKDGDTLEMKVWGAASKSCKATVIRTDANGTEEVQQYSLKFQRDTSDEGTDHEFGEWKNVSAATVFTPATQVRECVVCGEKETKEVGKKLTPKMSVNVKSLKLQVGQTTKKVKVTGLAKGDKVAKWTTSNKKIVTVSQSGVIKAQKKTGKATVSITLKSGKKQNLSVTVQKGKVRTTKISGLNKKITLVKGKTFTLKPVIAPITSQEKVSYSTSNKKVVTVDSKGKLKAKKAGKTKITVKSGKKKIVITVTVKNK